MLTSKDLLKSQLEQVTASKAKKTKPVHLPKDIAASYNSQLLAMVRKMNKDFKNELLPLIKSLYTQYTADADWGESIEDMLTRLRERWNDRQFEIWANDTARKFVYSADQYTNRQMKRLFSPFGITVYESSSVIDDYLSATIRENVALIKSIQSKYFDSVEAMVYTNMRAGLRPSAIEDQLTKAFGVSSRRARMIARDQTSKAVNGVARKRMKVNGVSHFQWVTSHDERVRSRHRHIANKVTEFGKGIYSFSDLPLSDSGEPIAPGDDYQCRCVARPVLESEVKENQAKMAKGNK